jgi:RND family efflux transporter MFP subunit
MVWLLTGMVLILLVIMAVRLLAFGTIVIETATVTNVYPSQTFTLLNASGYVVAQRKAAVASKTTARLEWLGVQEGSRVKAGQILARLENRDSIAARDQATAGLASARANRIQAETELTDALRAFNRSRELLAGGIVAQADFDVAEARVSRARAALDAAQASIRGAEAALSGAEVAVEYSLIRAPFDAVVLTKNADIGDIVTPIGAAANSKSAVVTIADLASLEVEADVSESSLVRVKQGQPCEIQLDALPDERFRGVLQTIVPTADRSKASVMVKVRFIDRDLRVMPEMSAKVAFLEKPVTPGEQHPKTAVSPAVVADRGGRTVVFVIKGDRASERAVTLGQKVGDLVEVTAGVKAGEKIIASPIAKLKDGVKVKLAGK